MRWSAYPMLLSCLAMAACPADSEQDSPTPPAKPAAATQTASAKDAPPAPWSVGLAAALGRGVEPPSGDDGTYRVDPFVAALVFEEFTRTGGKPWFEPFESDGSAGKPKVGYRVLARADDSLVAAIGLNEGDIVEAVNGVVLSGPERIGFALDGAENRVTLMVFREDYSFTMSYRLTQAVAWRAVLSGFTGDEDPKVGVGEPAVVAEADINPPGDAPAGTVPRQPAGSASRAPTKASPSRRPGTGSARPSPAKPRGSGTGPISCSSSSRCTIERGAYQEMVASPSKLQKQVKVVPAIRNNVHSGYKITSIKSGSPAAKLGFRSGDKITHINGRDLSDDMQALQLYWSLGGTKLFKVRFVRGSKRLVKTITVE